MWVLDHLGDLESDLSRFHRVEDIYDLDGPRFFRLAGRIFAYEGVMAARVASEREQDRTSRPAPQRPAEQPPPPRPRGDGAKQRVTVSQLQLIVPGLIERVEVPT